jgi:hypothetical protein
MFFYILSVVLHVWNVKNVAKKEMERKFKRHSIQARVSANEALFIFYHLPDNLPDIVYYQ